MKVCIGCGTTHDDPLGFCPVCCSRLSGKVGGFGEADEAVEDTPADDAARHADLSRLDDPPPESSAGA